MAVKGGLSVPIGDYALKFSCLSFFWNRDSLYILFRCLYYIDYKQHNLFGVFVSNRLIYNDSK